VLSRALSAVEPSGVLIFPGLSSSTVSSLSQLPMLEYVLCRRLGWDEAAQRVRR